MRARARGNAPALAIYHEFAEAPQA